MTFFFYFPYPDYKTYLLIFVSKFCLIYYFTSKFFMKYFMQKIVQFCTTCSIKEQWTRLFFHIFEKNHVKIYTLAKYKKNILWESCPDDSPWFQFMTFFLSKFKLPWTSVANIPSNTHKTFIYLRSIVGFSVDLSYGIFNRYPEIQHTYTYI